MSLIGDVCEEPARWDWGPRPYSQGVAPSSLSLQAFQVQQPCLFIVTAPPRAMRWMNQKRNRRVESLFVKGDQGHWMNKECRVNSFPIPSFPEFALLNPVTLKQKSLFGGRTSSSVLFPPSPTFHLTHSLSFSLLLLLRLPPLVFPFFWVLGLACCV
jgi:hypothetical protein